MRYRVAASVGGTTTSLLIDIERGVTVGEVCAQLEATLGGDWTRGIFIHGDHFDHSADADSLSLVDGAMLSATERMTPPSELAIELQGIAGEFAGVHHRLTRGSYTAAPHGQIPVATASDVRLTVDQEGTVLIDPPGSEALAVNGTPIDGPAVLHIGDSVQIGGTVWRLARPRQDPIQRQRILFNRPPRLIAQAPDGAIQPARRKPEPAKRTALRWTTIVAPLLMGLAMFAMFHRLIFLAFMLLSPVMAGFNWIDDRFRVKRERKRNEAEFALGLTEFETAIATWRVATRRHIVATHPDLSAVVHSALRVGTNLWERRPRHTDFLSLVVGYGRRELPVPLAGHHEELDDEVVAALTGAGTFDGVSITVDLTGTTVVGVCGERSATTGIVRSLVMQAAVHHGPADLQIAVITCPRWATDWSWTAWLPHVEGPTGSRLLATGTADRELVRAEVGRSTVQTLVVIDAEPGDEVATLIAELQTWDGVSVIALSGRSERLPSTADPVIVVESAARITVTHPTQATAIDGLSPALVPITVADDVARSLARVVDPERTDNDSALPTSVNLLDLLDLQHPTADLISDRWKQRGERIAAPIGITEAGPFTIDIVHDGPHGLLAGTTGAGKSELLRSLVAGLAATTDPEHLNFVLIDYKGGSAFDVCADLPHVVGVVTDLDDHLARRALTCLEAELHHRERVLRDAGASDLPAYLALGQHEPLPRLFIVMDEFAAMARELPEFMDALVDIGARGRSLGVHMVLATQRPAGVVKDNIRANTNLRLCLRVQDGSDSRDVIDDTIAAAIPRSKPGRGYVRLGPSELTGFQTALVTGVAGTATPRAAVHPIRFGPDLPTPHRAATPDGSPTDLERLVNAIGEAFERSHMARPKTPWPPSLEDQPALSGCALGLESGAVPLGVVDDPASQSQFPYVWIPSETHLLVYGLSGSGPEQVIKTAAHAVAATLEDALTYVIAAGTAGFDDLAHLPNVSGVVDLSQRERLTRVLRSLDDEVSRRRTSQQRQRPMVLLVDDVGALRAEFSDHRDAPYVEILNRIVSHGTALGVHLVATAYQAQALPMRQASLISQKLVMELAERSEFVSHGLRPTEIPSLCYARGVETRSKRTVQIATQLDCEPRRPTLPTPPIALMPTRTALADVAASADFSQRPWRVPFGIGDTHLRPAVLALDDADHMLVAGSARSGKSTLLARLAETFAMQASFVQLVAVLPKRSPLRGADLFKYVINDMAEVDGLAEALVTSTSPVAVFVDDADMIDSKGLDRVLAARNPNIHVFAAGRIEDLKRMHGHWTARVRRDRLGALLRPDEAAGDLFSIRLPRTTNTFPQGRGYLVEPSGVQLVQFVA